MQVHQLKTKTRRYDAGLMLNRYGGVLMTITLGKLVDNGLLWNGNAIHVTKENADHAVQNFGINPPLALPYDPRFTPANGAA